MRRAWLIALALGACSDSEPSSRVRIDVKPLARHAAQSQLVLDSITLSVVVPPSTTVTEYEVPLDVLEVEVEVPAGSARSFEVRATAALALTYWGVAVADVPPRTLIDVTIPTFPAGVARGSLQLGGAAVADETALTFTNADPLNGRPATLSAFTAAGAFERILPTGSYGVAAAADTGGVHYVLQPTPLTMTQGAVIDLGTLRLVPEGTPSEPALPPSMVGGSSGMVAGAASMSSSAHVLTIGAVSNTTSPVMQSARYRLQPASQPLVRVSP